MDRKLAVIDVNLIYSKGTGKLGFCLGNVWWLILDGLRKDISNPKFQFVFDEPIVVVKEVIRGKVRFRLIDGRKRLTVHRMLGKREIKAWILT